MNIVTASRILELTEPKTKFQKIKSLISNWKAVCITAIIALTLKSAAEQLAMMLIRGH